MGIGVQGPDVYFECSWDGVCCVLLVFQGSGGAFFLLLFALLGSLGVLERFGMGCLDYMGYLMGFSLRTSVCVFGLSNVFWKLLIGMLGCVWFT